MCKQLHLKQKLWPIVTLKKLNSKDGKQFWGGLCDKLMEYVEQRQQRFRNSKYYTLMNSSAKKINPLQAILKMIPSITNSGASFIGFNDLDISKFLIFCTVWSRKLAEVLLWNRKYPMIFFISTEKQQFSGREIIQFSRYCVWMK